MDALKNAVFVGFDHSEVPLRLKTDVAIWAKMLNCQVPQTLIQSKAQEILDAYPSLYGKESTLRFRFKKDPSDKLLKLIFDRAFEKDPERIISTLPSKVPFIPSLKKMTNIEIPRKIGQVAGNPLLRLIASIFSLIFTCKYLYKAFDATAHFVSEVALPYFSKKIGEEGSNLIKEGVKKVEWFWDRIIIILLTTAVVKYFIEQMNLPYVSPALKTISMWKIAVWLCLMPQTTFQFIVARAFDALTFVPLQLSRFSHFCLDIANTNHDERMVDYKQSAFKIWSQAMR